jgi:hypothetical protein
MGRAQRFMVHAGDANDFPPHVVLDGLAVAEHRDTYPRPGAAAHSADRILQVVRLHGNSVDGDYLVTAPYPRTGRRRTRDRRYDLDGAVHVGDFYADTRVAAGRADTDVPVLVCVEVLGVGVEISDHASYGAFEQLTVFERLYIILLDALHHFGEQSRVLPGKLFLGRRAPRSRGQQATADRQAQPHYGSDYDDQDSPDFQ